MNLILQKPFVSCSKAWEIQVINFNFIGNQLESDGDSEVTTFFKQRLLDWTLLSVNVLFIVSTKNFSRDF